MSGARIAPLFNIGPRIAGQILGLTYQHYRPSGVTPVIVSGNLLGTLPCWITPDITGKAAKPNAFGKAILYSWHDPALSAVGDYLVGPLGTFFIASQDVPAPIQIVQCNATISILRAASNTGIGAQPYGGDDVSSETPIMTGFPASILQGTKGEKGDTVLPGDVRMSWYNVIVPSSPGVLIQSGDIMNDANGHRYKISSTELTDMGWRLTAMLAQT